METIVLASNNSNKLKEFRNIITDVNILSLKDIGFKDEIEETGTTFLENSLLKAKTIHEYLKSNNLNYTVMSDDSGLCVNSLNGEPGLYSARYAGGHGNDTDNRKKLLDNLKDKADRSAYLICVVVKYYPNGSYIYAEGKTEGYILESEQGNTVFAYDCIFYSDELKKSFGEANEEEKNKVSHRGKAIRNLLSKEKHLLK